MSQVVNYRQISLDYSRIVDRIKETARMLFFYQHRLGGICVRLITTTTYINRKGEVVGSKVREDILYYEIATPNIRQMSTIKEYEEGIKIVVTRIEPDKN